jgi:outer membrane protein TolC
MKHIFPLTIFLLIGWMAGARAQTSSMEASNLLAHPLSRAAAVEIALRQNPTILKGQADLRASYGVEVQLRAIAWPQFSVGGNPPRSRASPCPLL